MRPDLVQWTSLAVAKLASELRLSVALGQADCCAVLVMVSETFSSDCVLMFCMFVVRKVAKMSKPPFYLCIYPPATFLNYSCPVSR